MHEPWELPLHQHGTATPSLLHTPGVPQPPDAQTFSTWLLKTDGAKQNHQYDLLKHLSQPKPPSFDHLGRHLLHAHRDTAGPARCLPDRSAAPAPAPPRMDGPGIGRAGTPGNSRGRGKRGQRRAVRPVEDLGAAAPSGAPWTTSTRGSRSSASPGAEGYPPTRVAEDNPPLPAPGAEYGPGASGEGAASGQAGPGQRQPRSAPGTKPAPPAERGPRR
ncbi:collagen alpha-1(I) chain-like [Calypte anna]|uniref:collagen alpha-1(I) chain-like n=1 Tax=Calypte anna TaxID=9244 RepID=UPI0011C40D4A|nr:collagen alpha-1(I) chain-like [Calypte anna]